ncbi:protein MpRLK-Pelle_RLCK-Vb [Marchantia polymorpha subsp. ruderalis]|uniref:non-specific serine/threonine protein kinase n=2 Tax=Marchantia polymorpha TaxID=3197 RepID=A0AAF6BUQ3_MARPO|nr:hypothetical protein MARPO_0046s0087 [Marchantia polymorpha]BBN15737.1 hypothetical protein Mp_7g00370 [Marchantia polymorpha subsp. ruderalis]|eukprot:PTQ39272.1 hypothetical protein MARPO_0046s0087 [Marchantia polymorpha]
MSFLNNKLSKTTSIFNLKLWVVIGIGVGIFIFVILFFLSAWLVSRRRDRKDGKLPMNGIPDDSKEIKEVRVDRINANGNAYLPPPDGILLTITESPQGGEKMDPNEKMVVHVGYKQQGQQQQQQQQPPPQQKHPGEKFQQQTLQQQRKDGQIEKQNLLANDKFSPDGKARRHDKDNTNGQQHQGPQQQQQQQQQQVMGQQLVVHGQEAQEGMMQLDRGNHILAHGGDSKGSSDGERRALLAADTPEKGSGMSGDGRAVDSPAALGPEVSHLGWGHWYTLRELEAATEGFAEANVLGEGGYGIVYRGQLVDGTLVAVKKLLNNRGQAEKEFRVEVDAIGRVRHKNLVRLLGYCAEGAAHRILVYEYVDNGNLEQWLHGPLANSNALNWDARMKIVMGTAKGLAYLHEALEPKVVHRDVKSSNILVDGQWNAKVSDFGLAKLLGSGKSHVTTRVMGTFGYVAPEYANTGLLNERSDVYSFGVLLMEIITGRDPVDYSRPSGEVNLVDWLKMMVGNRRSEEVADPRLEIKPTSRALKRALLVALRCVDPDSVKRPKMGQVVHMLEAEDFPFRDVSLSILTDRRISRDARSRRTDSLNQERMLKHLSAKDTTSTSKAADQEDSDNSVDSPRNLSYVKKYRRYEG